MARDINAHKRDELFAATPPVEVLKPILSITTTSNRGAILMANDIGWVFFHARAKREVYAQFPTEDIKVGEEQMCGKFKYCMHGTRDAAQNWYEESSSLLIHIGFQQGNVSRCVPYRPEKGIRTYAHGDDYVSIRKPAQLKRMRSKFVSKYTVETQTLGPGAGNQQQIKIFNRIAAWHDTKGISNETDPGHIGIILKQLQLTEANPATTPGTKEEGRMSEDHGAPLADKEATSYRA